MQVATLRRVLTFAAVGVINTGIYAAISYGGVRFAGMAAGIAAAIGYICGALFSYFANRTFTFRSQRSHRQAGLRFVLANGLTFLIGVLIPVVLVDIAGWGIGPAVIVASLAVPPCNFILMNRFVFAGQDKKPSSPVLLQS